MPKKPSASSAPSKLIINKIAIKSNGSGRKPQISKDDIIGAALKLLGPSRSVSSLSLREIAREAEIAPNSFYRHFRDMDELNLALIDLAGLALRKIVGEARHRVQKDKSIVRTSIETFMEMLTSEEKLLHILLREGNIGSDSYKKAVEKELMSFEKELCIDLIKISQSKKTLLLRPELVAQAITRLVFTIGSTILDKPIKEQKKISEDLIIMIKMILNGSINSAKE